MLLVSKGDVVRLSEAADFMPYAVVPKGERGTVVWIDREQGRADIKLHNEFPGLKAYENCVWAAPDAPLPFKVVRKASTAKLIRDVKGVIARAVGAALLMGTGVLVAGASSVDEQLIAWIEALIGFY